MNDFCLNDLGKHAVIYNTEFVILNLKDTKLVEEYGSVINFKVGQKATLYAYDDHDPVNHTDKAPFLLKIFDGIIDFYYIYVTIFDLKTLMGAGQFMKFYRSHRSSMNVALQNMDYNTTIKELSNVKSQKRRLS